MNRGWTPPSNALKPTNFRLTQACTNHSQVALYDSPVYDDGQPGPEVHELEMIAIRNTGDEPVSLEQVALKGILGNYGTFHFSAGDITSADFDGLSSAGSLRSSPEGSVQVSHPAR